MLAKEVRRVKLGKDRNPLYLSAMASEEAGAQTAREGAEKLEVNPEA